MASKLFEPLEVGALQTPNRIWMAPLTRSRSLQPGDVPWELNAAYYRQRATAGLIISEATQVSAQGKGYAFTPGIHSDAQVEGWRKVTNAVHEEGGKIFLQLWHVGRISHVDLQQNGVAPVAPSAIRADAKTYIDAASGMVPVSEPRALEHDEIPGVVEQFRDAAQRAKVAGFDGVEVHGANGYLIDQFTRDGTNQRSDAYGGSLENRLRFPLEVTRAVVDVWGAERVGYRVSPTGTFGDIRDSQPLETFGRLTSELGELGLSYIHVVEAFAGQERVEESSARIRESFPGVYVANGAYDRETGASRIEKGFADAITYGELFIANPDLPKRFETGAGLTEPDRSTYYGGTAKGYVDYPTLEEEALTAK